MTSSSDDAPKTPPETPSALHKLGLHECPACKGHGVLAIQKGQHRVLNDEPLKCQFCDGAKRVSIDRARMWFQVKS